MPRERQDRALCTAERRDRAEGQAQDRCFRGCRSPAITRCILSSSTRRAIFSSISPRRRIPARRRTACSNRPGIKPCTELETRAGIWRYDANKLGQKFSPAERYVDRPAQRRGLRLRRRRPALRAPSTAAISSGRTGRSSTRREAGAEAGGRAGRPEQGADYGWPECYFDGYQQKLVLAPEYGGDGGRARRRLRREARADRLRSRRIGRRTIS